jgi:hypothetical protein
VIFVDFVVPNFKLKTRNKCSIALSVIYKTVIKKQKYSKKQDKITKNSSNFNFFEIGTSSAIREPSKLE